MNRREPIVSLGQSFYGQFEKALASDQIENEL